MQVFGGEQFLAFFLTAGMLSSLTSYAGRLRSLKGGHSLGASGAVYACFAGMAILYPGMHVLQRLCMPLIAGTWQPHGIGCGLLISTHDKRWTIELPLGDCMP